MNNTFCHLDSSRPSFKLFFPFLGKPLLHYETELFINQEELQVTKDWIPEFLILEGVSSHQTWLVKEEAGLVEEEDLTSSMKRNGHNLSDSLSSDPGSPSIRPLNTSFNPYLPESLQVGMLSKMLKSLTICEVETRLHAWHKVKAQCVSSLTLLVSCSSQEDTLVPWKNTIVSPLHWSWTTQEVFLINTVQRSPAVQWTEHWTWNWRDQGLNPSLLCDKPG